MDTVYDLDIQVVENRNVFMLYNAITIKIRLGQRGQFYLSYRNRIVASFTTVLESTSVRPEQEKEERERKKIIAFSIQK